VLADERTAAQQVLDALRREPETNFAIHDATGRLQRLLDQRAELRALLRDRPTDARPVFRQAELALESAKKQLYWAHYRLEQAQERLHRFGPVSQLRSHGRKAKASTLDDIDRFTDDIRKAEAKAAEHERHVEDLRPKLDQRLEWDVEHGFPDARLRAVEDELAALDQARSAGHKREASLLRRIPGVNQPWLDRLAEPAPPPLPGHGDGPGIDLGL